MSLKLLRRLPIPFAFGICLLFSSVGLKAQGFSFNCSRDTVVPGCPPNLCITLKGIIPDIHGLTSSYTLNPGSFSSACFPVYVAPNDPGGSPTNLTIDDRYSGVINMGFPFPFYGTTYNSLVASTNGYVSFDISLAGLFSHYQNFGDLPTGSYDKALIMGPYHDLDPSVPNSPTKKIQYQVWGVAPHRRWVLSFYRVPLFQCNTLFENTHQIILYESTGIIEVKVFDKQICGGWQAGKSMIGIQDFTRTQGMIPPLRKMSDPAWGFIGMNETWRFVPNGGPSLLKRVELYDLSNTLIATGTTIPLVSGCLEASFANVCAPAGTITSYIIKSVYQKIDDPFTEIFGTDTVRVNRSVPLTGNATATPAGCGLSNGTITVTGVTGGTAPYEYSLDGITWQSSNVFSGLAAGSYTVYIRDFGSVCTTTISVAVGVSGNIPATTTTTPTACSGANNGSITITSAGGSGPYLFSLDGGAPIAGTIPFTFSNLAAGNHTILVTDQILSCSTPLLNVNVPAGIGVTGLGASTPTTCAGVNNGTITVTALTGVAPFTWQLDANPAVPGASPYTFTNVSAGPHSIRIFDNLGCVGSVNVNVAAGPGINGSTTSTATTCPAAANGTITATALSGMAPYTWSLDGAPPVPGASPYTFNNVTAGLHSVTIIDNNGCNVVLPVNVAPGPGINGSTISTATSCPGVNNGTIVATALTGTAPFTWQLDAGPIVPGASPYTFTNVTAGVHSVRITDNLGCIVALSETVAAGAGINGNAASTATSCPAASNGTITATALTGTAPYTWKLDGGAAVPGASPYTFTNVAAGPHTVTIIDNLGCNVVVPVTVVAGSGNTGNATSTATSCPAVSNGTIIATALTGTGPFTWQLDGGAAAPGASPYTFTNVAAGPHTVTITDNIGCNVNLAVTVVAGSGNTGNATSTATSCAAAANGSITATALTGTAPFNWQLDGGAAVPGASPYTFINVTAGPHTVTIADNIGCNVNVAVTVVAGSGNTGSANSTATSCPAVSNGTIIATALTGTAPFRWQLDGGAIIPGASPYTFTNVAAGPHTVTITDNIGCNVNVAVTVVAGSGNTGNATSTATSCPAAPNGTITATALTGIAPFTWQLDGGAAVPGASPYTFSNVASGPHTVTIIDIVGCNVLLSVTVNPGPPNGGSTITTPTSCPAVANGTIIATALTGTAPFTWQLDGGAIVPGASPYTFINVAAGPHVVIIADNFGCAVGVNAIVNAGAGISANLSSTATACAGVSNGTITVNATTGTPPYTYQLDGGAPQSGANPYTFINVTSGLHTITITDNVGCSYTNTVTVAVGPGVSGNGTSTATSCPTALNGTITADATAGTAPFTWKLDAAPPVPGATPHTFNNVAAGPHSVTITDNFGCNVTINVMVTPGPLLNATVNSAATSCSGASNGTVTATPVNGIAPYTFSLDGGAPIAGAGPYTFNNVPAGPHNVVITDAANCVSNSIPVVVNAGPVLTTTVAVTDALCNAGATGIITVTQPVIGAPPYQYSLNGVTWQASNVFNGLIAGNYTVYYRESNGCQGSQPVTVSEPAAMITSSATVAAICKGQNNGIITITAGGGVTPYQYSIDGGVTWQASNIFNVAAGSYTISIRDANNCTKTQAATVTEPALLTASSVNGNASCNGGSDGIITVNAAGGNSGYSYSIDGVNFQPSNVFNVTPGNYTITVKDNLGCTAAFNTVVGLTNNLTLTPQTDPFICEGTSIPLQLTSNATIYSWTPATGLSNTTISNPVANPTVTTQYIVTATLGGCSADDTVMVNVNPAPISDAGPDGFICYGQTYQLQGSGGVQYTWTPSINLSSTSISNPVSTPVKTITYTLTQVIDAIGCKSLTTDQVIVDVTPPIKVKTFPYDTIGYPGDQFQLNATSSGTFYSWSPVTGLSNPNIPNPVLTVGPIGSDILYQVIASTAAGCRGEGYVNLKVYKGPELYVPTAFTPNGDGLNDIFYPFPVGIKSINYFKVFNRWGQLLFSTTTLNKGWDGKLQGVEQPSGVYVFMAQGVDKNGKLITHNGTVTLIR